MLDAVIFDCDGVLVDSEPAHFAAFRDTLQPVGITMTRDQYFRRYPASGDAEFFRLVFEDRGRELTETVLGEMLERKATLLTSHLARIPVSAETFAFAERAMARGLEVAVASGARRPEVEAVLRRGGLSRPPVAVVCAGEVPRGKPRPDPFLEAHRLLEERTGRTIPRAACLVVEDSPAGVRAGRSAGMWVVGLTTSYSPQNLLGAHVALADLEDVSVEDLEEMLRKEGVAP